MLTSNYQPVFTFILDMVLMRYGSLSLVSLDTLGTNWYQYTYLNLPLQFDQ